MLRPVTLELGGKSSLIICGDADLDSAITGAMMANFYWYDFSSLKISLEFSK